MDRVIEFISEQVETRIKENIYPEFLEWLNKLKNGRPSDQRLLCSIGIDIKYNLVNLDAILKILEKINYGDALASSNPAHFFETVLRDDPDLHAYGLEFVEDNNLNEPFVRIMSIDTFNSYFYNRIEDIDDVKLANDNLITEIERGQLFEVKMPNDGPPFRKCAWITPRFKIQEIINKSKNDSTNPANVITDYLGLIVDSLPTEYIMIEYPEDFVEKIYQPCSLNASWYDSDDNPGLFISFKRMDKFGRTRQRKKDYQSNGLLECIHEPISSKYVYNIKYLGKVDNSIFSVEKIGNEALLRFF